HLLTDDEIARAHQLGHHLEAVWQAPTTTARDRKAAAAHDHRRGAAHDRRQASPRTHRVKGGAVTDRDIVRFRPGDAAKGHAPAEGSSERVRKLAGESDDTKTASIPNRQGHRSGRGLAFTKSSIASLRGRNRIATRPAPTPRDEREGPFTADQAARELGVS